MANYSSHLCSIRGTIKIIIVREAYVTWFFLCVNLSTGVKGRFDTFKLINCIHWHTHLRGMELHNTWDFFLEIGSNILDFLYSKVAKANY